jgi:hypothetical protein
MSLEGKCSITVIILMYTVYAAIEMCSVDPPTPNKKLKYCSIL